MEAVRVLSPDKRIKGKLWGDPSINEISLHGADWVIVMRLLSPFRCVFRAGGLCFAETGEKSAWLI
jgi:hypothetical protein